MVEMVQHRVSNKAWTGYGRFQEMLGVIKEEHIVHKAQEGGEIGRLLDIQAAKAGMQQWGK